MMEGNQQLALRIDGALQAAGQEVSALRAELTATSRRLAELSACSGAGGGGGGGGGSGSSSNSSPNATEMAAAGGAMENSQPSLQVLLREEVSQLQEEVHLLRQMKEMLTKDLEETHGGKSTEILSATELKVQLAQKEQELARAKEALQAMKADRKRLKGEKTDLVSQMQQLYATLESREEQLRDFIRNYEQHRKESEDAVKALAKEKDLLEREKWELRRQAKDATDHASALRSQLDLKDNRMKELEAELAMAKQSLATLTKDVPKRHSLAMPGETVLNGNQEWVMQADLPLTAAIRQSQQTLYHAHPQHTVDRQAVRVSPCHSRQPSIISDASAAEGDRSSTPSDINSPRHRTHSLCNVRRLCRSLDVPNTVLTHLLALFACAQANSCGRMLCCCCFCCCCFVMLAMFSLHRQRLYGPEFQFLGIPCGGKLRCTQILHVGLPLGPLIVHYGSKMLD
uniref:Kazrin, periplakin interacting protein n=1 Tax=Podarcis muralis TaxID=64176 RepID=A0A670J7F5_PODMU